MDPSRSRWLLPGLSNASLLRFLLVFACGWASLQLLNFFSLPISLFLVAGVLAVLLDTPVRWVSRLMPRPLAIALTTLTALGLVVAFVTGLGQQLAGQGQALLAELEAGLRQIPLPISPGQRELDLDQALQLLGKLSHGLDLLGGAFSKLMAFVVVLVLAVYMLADGGRLLRSLLNRLPQPFGLQLQGALERSVLGFLRGQLSLVAFLSVASALLFQALGATLGVAVVAVVVVLTQGPWLALRVVIGSVLLQQVQDNLLHPRVMGRALSLPPLVLFFSLFVGERIAGLLGVFLAIPVAGVIVNWPREPALPEQG